MSVNNQDIIYFSMKRQILFGGVAVLFAFFVFPQTVGAIGISPPKITVENVANNIEFKQVFNISRGNPSKREFFEVTLKGDGAKYLSFDPIFELPKGQTSVPFDFSLKPVGAPNGTYNVKLVFHKTTPPKGIEDPDLVSSTSNGMSVSAGVIGSISFTVTDKEIKNFVIRDAYFEDTEVGQHLAFYFTVQNLGNVDVRPERVEYTISQILEDQSLVPFVSNSFGKESFEITPPGVSKLITLFINDTLPEGRYSIDVKFSEGSENIFSQENVRANVYPQGFLTQKAEIKSITLAKNHFEVGELVKFQGVLDNTGDIALEGIMSMEVIKDEKSLDIISSSKKVVLRRTDGSFELLYKPLQKGKYTAKVHFEYGVSMTKSAEQVFEFTVGSNSILLYVGLGVGVLLVLCLVVVVARKFLRKNKTAPVVSSSPSPAVPPQVVVPQTPRPNNEIRKP